MYRACVVDLLGPGIIMCDIYTLCCVYRQSRSCQLPFRASPIFHFENFTCIMLYWCDCVFKIVFQGFFYV